MRDLLMRTTQGFHCTDLNVGKFIHGVRTKTRPIQAQRRVVRGDGRRWHGNFNEIIVSLSPKNGPISLIQRSNFVIKFIAQKGLKGMVTLIAIALI